MTTDPGLFPAPPAIPVADTIRHGLTQCADRCWMILNPHGTPNTGLFFEDSAPHFDTLKAAVVAAFPTTHEDDDERPPMPDVRPTQLDEPCWTATAVCGTRFGQDDADCPGVTHFETREQAAEMVVEAGWRVDCGALLCPDEHEAREQQ